MNFETAAIIGYTFFKIGSLTVGLAAVFMGYRLFQQGFWGHPTELAANMGENRLLLKSAAPGTFFALFGTAVVVTALVKGFNVDLPVAPLSQTTSAVEEAQATPPPLRPL
jgi:hypothetical protein